MSKSQKIQCPAINNGIIVKINLIMMVWDNTLLIILKAKFKTWGLFKYWSSLTLLLNKMNQIVLGILNKVDDIQNYANNIESALAG